MKKNYQDVLGDAEAFNLLYQKYQPVVYRLKKEYFIKDFDCEDWLQEGRIIFHRSLERYSDEHCVSIGQFFKRNFENHIRSLVRKQCALKRTIDMQAVSLDESLETHGELLYDQLGVVREDTLDQMIIREKLEIFPDVLSNFEKTTLEEYISGKEFQEIAAEGTLDTQAVKSAYQRVKKKLKTIIYE